MSDGSDIDLNASFVSCCSSSDDFLSTDSDSSMTDSLHDKLSSIFSLVPNNFNIVHINAQSIPGHYPDLLATFDSSSRVDAILVSESFLKPSLPSTQYSLPGYKLIRNDRTGVGCGGVAIYLRADIPHSIVSAFPSPYSASAEHLFLEISLHHTKVFLAVFYSPSLHID